LQGCAGTVFHYRPKISDSGTRTALLNLGINGAIAWAIFHRAAFVSLWGPVGIAADTVATSLILPFLTGVIVTLLFLGWIRRERPDLPGGRGERAATGVVIGLGVALPIVLLVSLFVWSDLFIANSVAAPTTRTPLTVRVIGHQWWWEVRYPGSKVVTANEIHIPVRTKVTALVTTIAGSMGSFPVPVTIVPGELSDAEVDALS